MTANRMTVKDAAALMGVSEQFVRLGIRRGSLPIGHAVQMRTRWTYHISPQKFTEATGIPVPGRA